MSLVCLVLETKPQKVTDHELASRLSYFLWGSLPDDSLLKAADVGNLSDPTILQEQFKRMLGTQNSRKVRNFSQNFVEQWLGTRALGREFKPDKSIRGYDSELEGGMKYEPVFFFNEILTQNQSLLDKLIIHWMSISKHAHVGQNNQLPAVEVACSSLGGTSSLAQVALHRRTETTRK